MGVSRSAADLTGAYQTAQQQRQRNSIALYRDKLYLTAPDAGIIALDAQTGEQRWAVQVHDWHKGFGYTAGPLIAKGRIFAGVSGCTIAGTAGGCFLTAHDAETGKELWRLNTLASDSDPQVERSWNGVPRENRFGGSLWITGSYDIKRNMLLWGVGMPAPWPEGLRGSADGTALYTNATLAINADTGEVRWHYQHLPRDNWDLDSAFERIPASTTIAPAADQLSYLAPEIHPRQRYDVVLTVAGKYGTLFAMDRNTGKLLWAHDTVYQNVIKATPAMDE